MSVYATAAPLARSTPVTTTTQHCTNAYSSFANQSHTFGSQIAIIVCGGWSCCGWPASNTSGSAVECWQVDFQAQPFLTQTDGVPPSNNSFIGLGVGKWHACGINQGTGQAVCWGKNKFNQADPPTGTNYTFTAVWAAGARSFGIDCKGGVAGWGIDRGGVISMIPAGLSGVWQVSTFGNRACGLRVNGSVQCWGTDVPTLPSAGPYSLIAVGQAHFCGLRTNDSAIECDSGVSGAPTGTGYSQLCSGIGYSCALNNASVAVCWGAYGVATDTNIFGPAIRWLSCTNQGPCVVHETDPYSTTLPQIDVCHTSDTASTNSPAGVLSQTTSMIILIIALLNTALLSFPFLM